MSLPIKTDSAIVVKIGSLGVHLAYETNPEFFDHRSSRP
jgi:hypothetical protein